MRYDRASAPVSVRRILAWPAAAGAAGAVRGRARLTVALGGAARARVILVLAGVLGLASADAATVGASAAELRRALAISNTDLGLLVTVTSLVAAVASLPFGVLADRVRRTWTLGAAVACWGAAMVWSAAANSFGGLLLARLFLGVATAAAGPLIASLTGDYFPGSERGRVYGYILTGDLVGAGVGFGVTGDVAALSWRAAFILLALPAFGLAWAVARLPEPARGGTGALAAGAQPRAAGQIREAGPDAAGADGTGTDAQRLASQRALSADPTRALPADPSRMGLLAAARYVLRIRTNVILIIASACAYYFLAGVEIFGTEFTRDQYHINQAVASLMLLVLGAGAIPGVLAGGAAGDALLRRGHLTGRVLISALAATATVILFIPAIFTRDLIAALPYLIAPPSAWPRRTRRWTPPGWTSCPRRCGAARNRSAPSCGHSPRRSRRCCSAPWPTTSSAAAAPGCNGRSPSCSFPWPPARPCSTTPCVATPATSQWPAGTASSNRHGYRMSLTDRRGRAHRDRPGIPGSMPGLLAEARGARNIAKRRGSRRHDCAGGSVVSSDRAPSGWMRKLPACRVQVVRRSRGAYERRSGAG